MDAVLSGATHYSRPKIIYLPLFTSMHSKSKKENNSDKHCTFIKQGDNLTNKTFSKHADRAKKSGISCRTIL